MFNRWSNLFNGQTKGYNRFKQISYRKMAEILDIVDSEVKNHLEKLKKFGVTERIGGRGRYWRVNI